MEDKIDEFVNEYVQLCKRYGLALGYDTYCLARQITVIGTDETDLDALEEMVTTEGWEQHAPQGNFRMIYTEYEEDEEEDG